MITVEEAKNKILENVKTLNPIQIKISDAVDCVLAENIYSPLDLPPFNQSAMDGYAIKIGVENKYKVVGEVKAGDKKKIKFDDGEAIRIFTGAPVPDSADCVIIQENTTLTNKELIYNGNLPNKNDNIRLIGSQIRKGELALKKGTILNPAAIGFLASFGIEYIKVFKTPIVEIIVTGNELKNLGDKINYGEIYESNSHTLEAALKNIKLKARKTTKVKDNAKATSKSIGNALVNSDVVIISGGISVGKYDLVKDCLKENGVKELFYKVAQKPGKPLFVGKIKNKIVFALPGNPAATLVCFYEYVYPTLRKMKGYSDYFLPAITAKMQESTRKKNDRAYFLKGIYSEKGVLSLDGQESYMLKSFAEANALIYLPLEKTNIEKGEDVIVHLF